MIGAANSHKNLARFKFARIGARTTQLSNPAFRRSVEVAVGRDQSRRLPLGAALVPLLSMTTRAIQSGEWLSILLTMRPSGTCRTL